MNKIATSRDVNADDLSPVELLNLFEPNQDITSEPNGVVKYCSYDRMADPEGKRYLVAERGVGKTHILRLLEEQLKSKKHIVLLFGYHDESGILTNFKRLSGHFPNEQKTDIWLLAILEEVAIKLFNEYIDKSFLPSFSYKMIAWTLTKNLLNKYAEFFDYLKTYREDEWRRLTKKLKIKRINILKYIPIVKITLPTIANISFEINPLLFVDTTSESKLESEIGTRINFLGSSVWATLNSRKITNTSAYRNSEYLLTRKLPVHQSVYVIGDGLDQQNPLRPDEMIGLVSAVNFLNQTAVRYLGNSPNFKVLIAIRSVTYDYVIEPGYGELEHIRSHVEKLSWSDVSIKRLMARRILGLTSNDPLTNEQAHKLLEKHFPERIHYFGKDFNSSIDFMYKITGLRPRQVLRFWENCAYKANFQDNPYEAILAAEHLTMGLHVYAQEVAIDIAKEYDLEYKGLFDLLSYLSSRSHTLYRASTRESLCKKISDYREIKKNEDLPEWLNLSETEILNILYRVGVVGLPIYSNKKDKKADWVETCYVRDDPYKMVNVFDTIVVHPAFWNWLTNVQNETLLRRRYSFNLYDNFSKSILNLQSVLETILEKRYFNLNERLEHEESIAKFLALSKFIREYASYPETMDANLSRSVILRMNRVSEIFSETVFCQAEKPDIRPIKIIEMGDFYAKTILEYPPTYRRNKIKFVDNTTFRDNKNKFIDEYHEKIEFPWLSEHNLSPTERNIIDEFYNSLTRGKESLTESVKEALSFWKKLI